MELKYKYPKSVIEEIRNEYEFFNIIGVRCNLRSNKGRDYSVAYKDNGSSPCTGISCATGCIFGGIKTQEKLEKAKNIGKKSQEKLMI